MLKPNYRAKGAAKYLGVGLSTVWLYAKQGKLNPIKLSERVTIFTKEDLDRFINDTCIDLNSTDTDKKTGDSHEC